MRLFSLPAIALLLLAGCTGTAVINGSGGLADPTGDDDDDDAADDDDDDDDAADDDDATEPNPFAGDHDFAVYLIAQFGEGGEGEVFCEGAVEFTIDATGGLTGDGECASKWGGGDRAGYVFDVTGSVTADGDVDGTISVAPSRDPDDQEASPLSGSVAGVVDVTWGGEIGFGWGESLPYTGKITSS